MSWSRIAVPAVAALSAFALASCGTTPATDGTSSSGDTSGTSTTSTTASASLRMVAFNETYKVPNGESATVQGSMGVDEHGVIRSIEVQNPQGPVVTFSKNVSKSVVGKSLAGLQIDAISGASLTSAAFNTFLKTAK